MPEPLTPTIADPVARPEPPGDAVEQRPLADRRRWRPPAPAPCGRAGWWRSRAARPCRAAAARRRSAPRPPRCGTAAWTCAPAARGAARPAPCGRGSADGPRRRRPAARARPARTPSPRSRPRSRSTRPPPTSHVRVHTASRNHRSWVTTTTALRRASQVLGQPADALDVEVVGRLVEHEQVELADQRRGQRDPPRSPPDSPSTGGQPRSCSAEAVEDVAHPGVGGPLVLGRRTAEDERRAPVAPAAGRRAGATWASRSPPTRLTRPASGRPRAGEDVEQRGLAAAVEADDADAVARLHARATRGRAARARRRRERAR